MLGKMDVKASIHAATTTRSSTGGPTTTYATHGPYWASREYLSRKQMETEVATRITSFQQIAWIFRYDATVLGYLSKASYLTEYGGTQQYNIISVTKDKGRSQFLEVITELKE